MRRAVLLLLIALPGPTRAADPPADAPARTKRERLLEIYTHEAAGYVIYRDPARTEKVELRRQPVFSWTNPVRSGGQDGEVFVWTCRGRAEVIGTFFSDPATGPRNLNHELHSLSTAKLEVSREGDHTWSPKAAGVEPAPIPDAPAPAGTAAARLAQMREATRDFAATTEDQKGEQWQLRILPRPLFRYASTDPDVADGAVFAYVTSAGTDPEVILILEARKSAGGSAATWHYAVARFTDLNFRVSLKGKEVASGRYLPWGAPSQDPQERYRTFHDRDIPPVEDPAP